ncbi:MAG: VWA domain-containing protein, partial [Planctomycetes bacterium]|nr:VWA domain-containing protein [Planctomycetota bacterium]
LDAFGSARAPEGRRFLVIDTRWRNVLTPAVVRDQQVPIAYRIPRLADHLYLVAEGRAVIRPRESADVAGALSLELLELPHAGATAEGRLIYEMDARALPTRLDLRFYDFVHGFCEIPLLAAGPVEREQPIAGPAKNEVVEAAVFGVRKSAEFAGRAAPPGETFVVVDFRARSLAVTQADATAFDPKARPGAKVSVGTVADWKESRRYLHLVIDGVLGRAVEPETELDAEPRFLPDIFTGGFAVFLAPEASASLELRCDFPNAQVPGSSKILKPAGITLPLEGARPSPPPRAAIASVKDDFFLLSVAGQAVAARFAGEDAGSDRFLVLDVTVRNSGKSGEFFQTAEQLAYAAADGSQSPPDAVTERGPRRPGALVWIPAGEARSFQVVFRIAATERAPRLVYAGVSKAEVIALLPIESEPPAAAAKEGAAAPAARGEAEGTKPPAPPKEATAPPKTPPPPPAAAPAAKIDAREAPRVRARSDRTPRGLEGVGLRAEDVNRAIDRGSAFLWQLALKNVKYRQPAIGSENQDLPLALALVHAGAHHKDPAIDAAIRRCIAAARPVERLGCYENGVLAMLIESYGDPAFLPKLRAAARYLLEAQGPEGSWGYSAKIPKEVFGELEEKPQALRISGGRALDGSGAAGEDMARMTPWQTGQDGDNSSSQFALLGMHSAARCNFRLPGDVWTKCLAAYRKRQNEEDGGWGYTTGSSYGSMTCAGICALAINRFHLGESDPGADVGIERGLAWLAARFSVKGNPESEDWHYYYLYSLERVGRILGTEFIGEHEWYPLGARYLVDAQNEDGSWVSKDQENPRLDTSFALLFLTRATPRLSEELARGGSGTLRTSVALEPERRFYLVLDASGSMRDAIDGRAKFEIAREAVESIAREIPAGAPVALRVFGHRKTALEAGSSEDTALEIPMGSLNRTKFGEKLRALRPRGKTPLALSLREAVHDLAGAAESAPVTVVLLTDGGEDTLPRQDPLAAAAEFGRLRNVKLHIVGFDINREDWRAQLAEMARLAKGTYWPVARAADLTRELRAAVLGTPSGYELFGERRREVGRGVFGDSRKLPEGKYVLRTELAGAAFEEEFWINTDAVTSVCFDAGAAAKMAGSGRAPA